MKNNRYNRFVYNLGLIILDRLNGAGLLVKPKIFMHIVALLVWVIVWMSVKAFVPFEWHLLIGSICGGLYGVFVNEANDQR